MSELPKGWETATVGELAESIQYGHTASSSTTEVGPRFLRITDIQDNNVDWSTVPFCKIPAKDVAKYRLEKGDLLFARTGATVGKSFLIQSEVPYSVFASYLIRVRVSCAIDPRYIYYFFQSSDYWRQISESASGIGQPNVNGKKLAALTLPVAPLPEQRRIVARIEELFSRLDAGVAALRRAKAQLQRYRQSVLAAAVTGQLTQAWREQHPDTEPAEELLKRILEERRENWSGRGKYNDPETETEGASKLPPSWKWVLLGSLTQMINGDRGKNYPNKSEYVSAGVPWINTGHIDPNGTLSKERLYYITREKFDQLNSGKIEAGDLVYCLRGATFGKTAVVEPLEEGAIASSLMIIRRSSSLLTQQLLHFYLISSIGRAELFRFDNGSAQPNLSAASVAQYRFPLPPLAEQHQIVAEVEARTTAIDHLEAELDRQITRSNRLRQSTLAHAFSGNLL